MAMSATEKKVIRNVIQRLRCEPYKRGHLGYGETSGVRMALTGSVDPFGILDEERIAVEQRWLGDRDARLYLETWVIGALAALLDEEDGGSGRDPQLALSLSS